MAGFLSNRQNYRRAITRREWIAGMITLATVAAEGKSEVLRDSGDESRLAALRFLLISYREDTGDAADRHWIALRSCKGVGVKR